MGLLRRTFTRDVKMAAVQRLETGSSIAEVARAFEVNPNVLHRWRREFRDTGRLVLTEGRPTIALETFVRLMVLNP